MSLTAQLARHIRDVYSGGNWTGSNLKDNLAGVTWQEAVTEVHSFNTIATLVYHAGYYTDAILKVLKGEPLLAKDEYSFSHPPITSSEDWEKLLNKTWRDAEELARLVEELPESKLWEDFTDKKYGNYYRNIQGMVEHLHYHLGQIALIKKWLKQPGNSLSV